MKLRFVSFVLIILAGCVSNNTEGNFLCEAQSGLPCHSISQVDGYRGGFSDIEGRAEDTAGKSFSQDLLNTGKGFSAHSDGGYPYIASNYRRPDALDCAHA